jgi:hypothetical protein
MNKEQQELLDEAYRKYADSHWTPPSNPNGKLLSDQLWSLKPMEHSKESFINKCKTDTEFSEKWGLKIEERELSLEERKQIMVKNEIDEVIINMFFNKTLDKPKQDMYENSTPTKLITITYNDKTIESYE